MIRIFRVFRFQKTFVERQSWLVPIFSFWRVSGRAWRGGHGGGSTNNNAVLRAALVLFPCECTVACRRASVVLHLVVYGLGCVLRLQARVAHRTCRTGGETKASNVFAESSRSYIVSLTQAVFGARRNEKRELCYTVVSVVAAGRYYYSRVRPFGRKMYITVVLIQ